MVFCDWLLSLSTVFSRFTHIVKCTSTSFLFITNLLVILVIHSLVDGNLSCFYFLAITNNAAMNVHAQLLNCLWLFATPWTIGHQGLLSMEIARQDFWSGLPFPSPGDLSSPGIETTSLALAGKFFHLCTNCHGAYPPSPVPQQLI